MFEESEDESSLGGFSFGGSRAGPSIIRTVGRWEDVLRWGHHIDLDIGTGSAEILNLQNKTTKAETKTHCISQSPAYSLYLHIHKLIQWYPPPSLTPQRMR